MSPASSVVDGDVDDLGVEDLLDLVADEVVHRLHVELLRRGPAGRSLMIASSAARWSVSVSSRGLVEQPGVLERDAQAGRERRQQPDVGLAERVLAIEVLEGDDPLDLVADDERRPEGGPGRLTGQRSRFAECRELGEGVHEQRLARLETRRRIAIDAEPARDPASLSAIGSSGKRTPRSIVYGKCITSAGRS